MSRRGDLLSTHGAVGRLHRGIEIGRDEQGQTLVAHNSKKHGKVVIETTQEFSGGAHITVMRHAAPGTQEFVVQRALRMLGTKYDLVNWNCEHFANYAQTGHLSSEQLRSFICDAAGQGAVDLALALFNETSTNGRR